MGYEPDYEHLSSIYNDLSYENLGNTELPIPIKNINSLYMPDNDGMISKNPWSQLFHRHYARSIFSPIYYSAPKSDMALRSDKIHYIPYPTQKRTIPIELQKALFAHGIVGRRR